MSDNEIYDLAMNAIRSFNKEMDDTYHVALIFGFLVVSGVVVVFFMDGPLFPAAFLGGCVIGWIHHQYEKETKKIIDAYVAKGFEPDRLRVKK